MKRSKRNPRKVRILIFVLVLVFIPLVTFFVIQIAKGYRPDLSTKTLRPTGLLVAKSKPVDALVYSDAKLLGTTDLNINLEPKIYQIGIEKTGFYPWKKQLHIQKELVTIADALLFPQNPTLTDITNSPVNHFLPSPDRNRIAYIVPKDATTTVTPGLYIVEISDSPLNLNKSPRLILSHNPIDFSSAHLDWAYDSRQLLLRLPKDKKCTNFDAPKNPCAIQSAYLIDTQNPESLSKNIISTYKDLLDTWKKQLQLLEQKDITSLPTQLQQLLATSSAQIIFSPDKTKILYSATASAQLLPQIIPPIPGASTQFESRAISANKTYIYDLLEDKNFEITLPTAPLPTKEYPNPVFKIDWFSSSRHLIISLPNQIMLLEYDNTNPLIIFQGSLLSPAFPSTAGNKLFLVLPTNPTNSLYSLSLLAQ